jgi:hypothetical protein
MFPDLEGNERLCSLNGQVISRIINSYDLLDTAAQLLGICELKYMLTKLTSHALVYGRVCPLNGHTLQIYDMLR